MIRRKCRRCGSNLPTHTSRIQTSIPSAFHLSFPRPLQSCSHPQHIPCTLHTQHPVLLIPQPSVPKTALLCTQVTNTKHSWQKKFSLVLEVLEVNCISNLGPIIPYNWQSSEQLWASYYKKYDAFVVILSHWLLYLQDNCYCCMLFDVHAGVTSIKDAWSVVTVSTRSGCRRSASSLVVLCN